MVTSPSPPKPSRAGPDAHEPSPKPLSRQAVPRSMPWSEYFQTEPRGTRMPCECAGQDANAKRMVTTTRGQTNNVNLSFNGAVKAGAWGFWQVFTSMSFSNPGANKTPPEGNAANQFIPQDRRFTISNSENLRILYGAKPGNQSVGNGESSSGSNVDGALHEAKCAAGILLADHSEDSAAGKVCV